MFRNTLYFHSESRELKNYSFMGTSYAESFDCDKHSFLGGLRDFAEPSEVVGASEVD